MGLQTTDEIHKCDKILKSEISKISKIKRSSSVSSTNTTELFENINKNKIKEEDLNINTLTDINLHTENKKRSRDENNLEEIDNNDEFTPGPIFIYDENILNSQESNQEK